MASTAELLSVTEEGAWVAMAEVKLKPNFSGDGHEEDDEIWIIGIREELEAVFYGLGLISEMVIFRDFEFSFSILKVFGKDRVGMVSVVRFRMKSAKATKLVAIKLLRERTEGSMPWYCPEQEKQVSTEVVSKFVNSVYPGFTGVGEGGADGESFSNNGFLATGMK
ncbi:hypothetical protein TorRG33x02_105180 [Trema orientale]|uniref:Uncharacterized protein n=1 Tax=Trema orientale TaxID=63057 RepID=A0A2P5F7P8_TREOI|nr:hypothetical protein TorRG33x02_105180 [Trema orientale]